MLLYVGNLASLHLHDCSCGWLPLSKQAFDHGAFSGSFGPKIATLDNIDT